MNSTLKKFISLLMIILTVVTAVPVVSLSGTTIIAAAEDNETRTEGPFIYYIDEDEEVAVFSDIKSDAKGEITLPETLGGYPVSYEDLYIYGCDGITSIIIPDGLDATSVCIERCSGLKKVYVGSLVEDIFLRLTGALEKITVSKKNKVYSSVDGVMFNKDKTRLIKYPAAKKNTKYTVPDGVKFLGYNAFSEALYLTEVKMSDTVNEIYESCFTNCRNLKKISFSDTLNRINYSAFSACSNLKSIEIPDSVTSIGPYAFSDCDNLTEIKFGKGLEYLDLSAFNGCDKIKKIEIGANIRGSEDYFFFTELRNLPSLESITVNKKNKYYTSIDGVLFTKDKKELIKYPPKKTGDKYSIPSTVQVVRQCAFEDCDNLKEIELNDGLKLINYLSFTGCDSLKTIDIPNSVTDIVYSAFSNCDSLETVDIGSGVEDPYISLFEGSENLKEINVSKKNKTLVSKDGVLYNKELTRIVDYPYNSSIKTYKLPDSVTGGAYIVNGINLKSIEVGSKNKSYTSDDGVLYDKEKTEIVSYPYGKTDKTYTVPASVEYVNIDNKNIQSFKVSSKSKYYSSEDGILYDKSGIALVKVPAKYSKTTVTIPKEVSVIHGDAFGNCTKIESFSVEKGNKVFFAKKGVLFEKNEYAFGKVALYQYPAGKKNTTYTLPENVGVYMDAFDDAVYLKKIYVSSESTKGGVQIYAPDNISVYYGHDGHKTTEKTTSATLTKNGAVKEVCTVCDESVKTVSTIYYPKTVKLSETKYTYNGKVKTPSVTVKDSKGKTLKKGKDYTVKYSSGRKNPGKYSVTITFKGKYKGTKKLYFTIVPSKVTFNKVTAGSKSAALSWKTVTGASGYEVQYSASSKFKSAKKATVKKGSTKKTTIKKLTKGKKYYFKVRAYKTVDGKKICGAWSAVKSVKVK